MKRMPWSPERFRITTRRYRRILIACLATLIISAVLIGLMVFVGWRAQRAVETDTFTILEQAQAQLVRSLQSRRGTLTLLRDTLDRSPDLSPPQLQAMAASATKHTRHLLGVGIVRDQTVPDWWFGPQATSRRELAQISRTLGQRTSLRGVWDVPSTLTTAALSPQRPFLIMMEPLRQGANRRSAILGVFELKPLLADFVETTLRGRYPVQILDGDEPLFRSETWQPPTSQPPPLVVTKAVALDAARWTIQMQPGETRLGQTLTRLHIILIGLGTIAALGIIGIIWLLAMRTWLLQRAVMRRTQALRRTTARLRQLATTDELTGLHNRRFFLDRWQWEFERAKRYRRPLACLMIDVNEFKKINDLLGHHMGDLVLKEVAQELKTHLRQSDILARFGGDEFIVALPETNYAQAAAVAEKLRQVSLSGPWTAKPEVEPIRLSVGVSRLKDEDSPQEILQAADRSLYDSKRTNSMSEVRT